MAGTVTSQLTNVTLAETADAANWDDIGGGPGSGQVDGSVIQGSESRGRRIDNNVRGFSYDTTATVDISGGGVHVGFWVQVTQPNLINANGIELILGDAATPKSGNWSGWFFDETSYPPATSWLRVWVDPTATADTSGGTLGLGSVRQFGAEFDIGDVGGTSESCLLDRIDYTAGGLLIDAGTGGSPATFDDGLSADEGTSGNRYGVLESRAGTIFCNARITIGSATATVFTDSGFDLKFSNQELAASTFMGLTVDLQNAGTAVTLSDGSIKSGGATKLGDLVVSGSSGTLSLTRVPLSRLRVVDLNSACTLDGCTISSSGAINANGAALTSCSVTGSTAASALVWDVATDPNAALEATGFVSGGAGHAIELGTTSPTTINLTGVTFDGYASSDGSTGNEAIWVRRTAGTVTINISGGDTPTIRTDGATVVVNNAVNHTVTNLPSTAEVTYVRVSDETVLYHVETVGGTGTVTYAYNYTVDTAVNILIHDILTNVADIDGVVLSNSDQSVPATYEDDRVFSNP